MNFEFDELEIASSGRDDGAGEEARFDDDALDLELDLSEALGGEDYSQANPPQDIEPLLIADDADQLATKLDLARAYIDMGDSAGARSILDEVLESGSEEYQQEARELLSRLG
jgi:pilus assembly protein FimV